MAVITNYSEEFARTWPRVAPRLRERLLRRGVPSASVDDVVQETAVAALRRLVPFDTEDDLLAWSTIVSRRLAIADHRRRLRAERLPEVSEAFEHVEREALARVDVHRVLMAAEQLAPEERAAFSPTPALVDRQDAVRLNVRRHRARQKLLLLAGGLSVVIAVLRRVRAAVPSSTAGSAVAMAVLAAAITVVVGVTGPDHDHDAQRRANDRVVTVTTAASDLVPSAAADADSTRTTPTFDTEPRVTRTPPTVPTSPAPPAAPSLRTGISFDPPGPVDGHADVRPREEGEPELCVENRVTAPLCLDAPFPATPLDDLSLTDGF